MDNRNIIELKMETAKRSCHFCVKTGIAYYKVKDGDYTFNVIFCPELDHKEKVRKHAEWIVTKKNEKP